LFRYITLILFPSPEASNSCFSPPSVIEAGFARTFTYFLLADVRELFGDDAHIRSIKVEPSRGQEVEAM
jgi:hypothetical protein